MKAYNLRLNHIRANLYKKETLIAVFFGIVFFIVSFLPRLGDLKDGKLSTLLACITFPILNSYLLYKMMSTGKINTYRRIFFSIYALVFVLSFLSSAFIERGHMYATDRSALFSNIPICHIVMPVIAPSMFLNGTISFPGEIGFTLELMFLMIVIATVFGKSFCSWGCFFGGQDDFFAGLRKKPIKKLLNVNNLVRIFPYAFLFFLVIHSFATMVATFCFYFCPFKATTEMPEINSIYRVISTLIFMIVFVVFIIVIPYLYKKRSFCSLICPLGTTLNFFNKITLLKIDINKSKCINHLELKGHCTLCIQSCPILAVDLDSIQNGKMLSNCNFCTSCIEDCPTGAISLGIKGVNFNNSNSPFYDWKTSASKIKKYAADLIDPGIVFPFILLAFSTTLSTNNLLSIIDAFSKLLK